MKAVLCLPLFLASFAWADEPADRTAIGRAIAVLNEFPRRIEAVAESPSAARELMALLMSTASSQSPARPSVTISHEPWGEATINFPAIDLPNQTVSRAVRFITPDVALVDVDRTREEGTSLHKPVPFVRKQGGRRLENRPGPPAGAALRGTCGTETPRHGV